MKLLVIQIVLLVSCYHALPTNTVTDDALTTAPNDTEEENSIEDNVTSLDPEFYGFPKNSTGDLLSKWNASSLMNPEEMGEYAEGDILMPPVGLRNGVRSKWRRWKGGIIPYRISKIFKEHERQNILDAIADYKLLTCLRFVPRTSEKDYVDIVGGKSGCWSNIGYTGDGRQTVNLQRPGCVYSKGTVLHELLHTIGFKHEQNRSDRNKFVEVHFENIRPNSTYNFNKVSPEGYSIFTPYDYNSVIHYSAYGFSKNSKKTLIPKVKGANIGQRVGLSRGDVMKVNKMYNCKKKEPKTGWNLRGIFIRKYYKGY